MKRIEVSSYSEAKKILGPFLTFSGRIGGNFAYENPRDPSLPTVIVTKEDEIPYKKCRK